MTDACRIFEYLVYFTTRVPDTSDPRPIKSNTSDTEVGQGRYEYSTSATRATFLRHKCYTNDMAATRVKYFNFDNETGENIFSHPYISYITNKIKTSF